MAAQRKRRLGEILVASGVLAEHQLEEALGSQKVDGVKQRLGRTVLRLGFCTEEDIARALADQLGLGTVDLAAIGPEPASLSRVPRKLAERHHALPLRIDPDDHLVVAMSDPTNVVALDDIKLTSGLRGVRPVVATDSAVTDALRRAYGSDTGALEMVDQLRDSDVVAIDENEDLAEAGTGDEQPIIRLANAILADAVRTRTSDVHVEPERDHVRIRYRIDGMLRETMRVPKHIGPSLVSRLKIMSSLDIAERRRPQDGRSMIRVEGQEVDLRVSTMPTMFGETVVLRLLRKGAERLMIDDLGISPDARTMFEAALDRPQGLVMITGPTGSGKTTTLYAGLAEIADPVRNIITLEDPIEYQLEGINQTQVNAKVDLTFARGLRTVLRQDPDVVMVGEIRDRETAELAMEASFTGHLVLSTLHTNDAPSTIVRLVDLGVERFLIASSLILVVAQRLARMICPHCSVPVEPDPKTMTRLGLTPEDLADVQLMQGTGCQVCEQTGYLGRTSITEMLPITPKLRELITEGGSETAIGRLGRTEGMRTLREDGITKALAGVTTFEEVLRTTPEESVKHKRCPECSTVVGEDFVICPNCATNLGADSCPKCASRVEPGWETCPYCRESLTDTQSGGRYAIDKTLIEEVASSASARVSAAAAEPEHEPPASKKTGRAGPGPADVEILLPDPDDEDYEVDPTGRSGTILLVDDDDSVRDLVGMMLDDTYMVLEAVDADQALNMWNKHRPDAIVLDYKLPDMDGIELTRKIRTDEGRRHVPILMVTGTEDPAVEVEGLLAGVDDYIIKPFDEDIFIARLQAMLRRKFALRQR